MRRILRIGFLMFLLSVLFTVPAFAGETDEWLDDWDYFIYNSSSSNPMIKINGYRGDSPEAHVYGAAMIDGKRYGVIVYAAKKGTNGGVPVYESSFNVTEDAEIEELYFHSVDGKRVVAYNGSASDGLFYGMPSLRAIHFGDGVDFSNTYSGTWMFYGDSGLAEIDAENMNFDKLVKAQHMFDGASALREVTICFPVGSNFVDLFKGCASLEAVSISTETTHPDWIKCNEMFAGCSSLSDLSMDGFNAGGTAESKASMFEGCESLAGFDFAQLDMSLCTDCKGMFRGCGSLASLDLTRAEWCPAGVDLSGFVEGCSELAEIDIDEGLVVSDKTGSFGYVEEASRIRIVGRASESFDALVIQRLRDSNRYLTEVDVCAGVGFSDGEAFDGLSYGLVFDDGDERILDYDGSGEVYFSGGENGLFVFEPGEYVISLTQGVRGTDAGSGKETVVPLTESEDGFLCEEPVLTKRIRVSRLDDGSVSVKEI